MQSSVQEFRVQGLIHFASSSGSRFSQSLKNPEASRHLPCFRVCYGFLLMEKANRTAFEVYTKGFRQSLYLQRLRSLSTQSTRVASHLRLDTTPRNPVQGFGGSFKDSFRGGPCRCSFGFLEEFPFRVSTLRGRICALDTPSKPRGFRVQGMRSMKVGATPDLFRSCK